MTLTAELAGLSILNLDIKALVDAFGAPMAAAVQLANIAVGRFPQRCGFGSALAALGW